MSKIFVYSTLANDQRFTGWRTKDVEIPMAEDWVTVNGGSGVANNRIVTPMGVRTEVSEEQATFLKNHDVFKRLQARGFMQIGVEGDADAVAADMSDNDKSKPVTPDNIDDKIPNPTDVPVKLSSESLTVAAKSKQVAK